MRLPRHSILTAILGAALASPLAAAVHADIDVAALRRDAPDLLAALRRPPAAERLAQVMQERFGFEPRRDLTRVIIDCDGPGHPPILHLVGCPAPAIAAALATISAGEAVPAGSLLAMPAKPGAGFIALDADEALVGPLTALRTTPKPALDAPTGSSPIAVTWTPGPLVSADLAGLLRVELSGAGTGIVSSRAICADEPAAVELERRINVLRAMIDVGAAGALPKAVMAKQVLDATTVVRDHAVLLINAQIPGAVRHTLLERLATFGKGQAKG